MTIVAMCIAILFAGCTGTAPSGQKTGTGPSAGAQVKSPALIVPSTVPGFDPRTEGYQQYHHVP